MQTSITERFWSQVSKQDISACWTWMGGKCTRGLRDNMADCIRKGRFAHNSLWGEKKPSAKLKEATTDKTLKLNGGVALVANCAYLFDLLVHEGDTINFQTSVTGNVTLRVQEIVGGVQ